jgi:hypothetical protein
MMLLLPPLDDHIGHGIISLQGIPMIGTVLRVITPGFKNVIIIDDHPDITGKPLIGIITHQTAPCPLTQKATGDLDLKNTDTIAQRLPGPG